MEREFVPILAIENDNRTIWYCDISGLGLEELMLLKKELCGTIESSIRLLDKVIYSKFNNNRGLYDISDSRYRKQEKRNKRELIRRKRDGGKKKW